MDWHTVIAVVTVASMLVGTLVELVYRPARMSDVDDVWSEVNSLRERISVLEAQFKMK